MRIRTLMTMLPVLACAHAGEAADGAQELARMRQEIATLIGPAKCVNLVHCRVAALGMNACGGPAGYVVYSWLSTDKGVLETRIAEYNFLQEDLQKSEQATGACVIPPEPVAACVNGRCVLPPP